MRQKLFSTALLLALQAAVALAQAPESFFPHHVGDRWDYLYDFGGVFYFYSYVLTRDSIGVDGSHYLFYNNSQNPGYRIDTSYRVFQGPSDPYFNYLLYKLAADSGEAWENPHFPGLRWAWVARTDSAVVFYRPTVVKVFRYGPGHPDSGAANYFLEERWLASGFGLIYHWLEPYWFGYLRGCIIAGDTFGIITSVKTTDELQVPRGYHLKQNYPNPFNPSTTIEFIIPTFGYVSLKVFDLLGREMTTLVDRELAEGVHRVIWDGSKFPSGVYFLRMSTPHGTQTRKMILMR